MIFPLRCVSLALLVALGLSIAPHAIAHDFHRATGRRDQPRLIDKYIAAMVNIGWTKAQVIKANGNPNRTSRDGNTWYYSGLAIHFNSKGRVDGFPGGAG